MNFKKLLGLVFAVLILASGILAGPGEFRYRSFYLTPEVGVNRWTVPFGLSAEWAISPYVGMGGTGMIWIFSSGGYDYSNVTLCWDVAYHFTMLNARDLDLYAGGGLGFVAVSKKRQSDFFGEGHTSGLFLFPFLGLRYYVSPTVALSLRLQFGFIGDWPGGEALVGVTFRLR